MLSDEEKDKIRKTNFPMHFRNPKTGVSVWPVMVKDSEGNWEVSDPELIKSMMGPRKKKSGKK